MLNYPTLWLKTISFSAVRVKYVLSTSKVQIRARNYLRRFFIIRGQSMKCQML